MSEVKPTLVSYEGIEETVPTNSWLNNFPTSRWIDAQSRNWYWIMVNAVNVSSAYEYRIIFDVPVRNATLIFPFVVKTSDRGVKKVFINGVEYQARSKENYGNRFVVSGQEFKFKVATEYKLSKQTIPILILECKHAIFKSVEFFDIDYIRVLRYIFSNFNATNTMKVNNIAMRSTYPTFITSISTFCSYVPIRTTSSIFNNVNSMFVLCIANCRNTSWERFGGVWKSCETWMSLT
jgi:hypothetical protein